MADPEPEDEDESIYNDITLITPEATPKTGRKRPMLRPPEYIKRLKGNESALVGETVQLTCHVVGFPKPMMKWFRDDDAIIENSRVVISEPITGSYVLTINDANKKDEAAYKCRAENTEGSASSCWYLAIKGKREKSRKRRSRSCSPKRSVSFPPVFSTILEKVDEEQLEEEEIEKQPESPLTKLYYGPKDNRKKWTQFVGEWAFRSDDDDDDNRDESDSDDSEEEKIKREEKNNEKNTTATEKQDTETGKEKKEKPSRSPENEGVTTAAKKESGSGSHKRKDKNFPPPLKLKIPRSAACHDIAKVTEEKERGSERGRPTTSASPPRKTTEKQQKKGSDRPKSTDRPITTPKLVSHPVLPPKNNTNKHMKVAENAREKNNEQPKLESGTELHSMVVTNSSFGGSSSVRDVQKLCAESMTIDEPMTSERAAKDPGSKEDLPPSLKPVKDKSKSRFSKKLKEKGIDKRKRRRSLKSQRGSTGFLPSPEEIFLGLTAVTFFCILFEVSPVPFILLVLWGEISVCIFYSIMNKAEPEER